MSTPELRMRIAKLEAALKRSGDPMDAGFATLSQNYRALREQNPEVGGDLDKEWQRQAEGLAQLFAKPLGKSTQEYIEGLPRFPQKLPEYEGRLDIPVLVQVPQADRLPLSRMLDILGIAYSRNTVERMEDWPEGKFVTPRKPYSTWLDDGTRYLGKAVKDVRIDLLLQERGATHLDGLGLYVKDPDILKDHFLDFPGSQVGPGRAPCLARRVDRPWLGRGFVDDPGSRGGSVVAGRNIEVGTLAA